MKPLGTEFYYKGPRDMDARFHSSLQVRQRLHDAGPEDAWGTLVGEVRNPIKTRLEEYVQDD